MWNHFTWGLSWGLRTSVSAWYHSYLFYYRNQLRKYTSLGSWLALWMLFIDWIVTWCGVSSWVFSQSHNKDPFIRVLLQGLTVLPRDETGLDFLFRSVLRLELRQLWFICLRFSYLKILYIAKCKLNSLNF